MSQISYIPPMIKNFKNVKDDRRIKSQTVCGSVNAGSTNQPVIVGKLLCASVFSSVTAMIIRPAC